MMKLPGTYILNYKNYPHASFLQFLNEKLESEETKPYLHSLYQFILDFLDEDAELIQYTSGTTGEAKRVQLSREAMVASAERTISHFNLKKGNSLLLCLSVDYIAGKMMVVRALIGGMNLVTVEPKANPLAGLKKPIDFGAMVPLQVYEAIKQSESINLIRTLLIGGAEIRPGIRSALRKIKKSNIYESFAMTETFTHFAFRRLNVLITDKVFTTMEDVHIDTDERGCLVVSIPGVTEGTIVTNDMVEIYDYRHFRWLGRFDNVINSGGIKIFPEELEERIQGLLGVAVTLLGISDEKLGQKLVLVAECSEKDADIPMWQEKLKGNLLKHEYPREFYCIDKFPRNRSMKLNRIELRKWIKETQHND